MKSVENFKNPEVVTKFLKFFSESVKLSHESFSFMILHKENSLKISLLSTNKK